MGLVLASRGRAQTNQSPASTFVCVVPAANNQSGTLFAARPSAEPSRETLSPSVARATAAPPSSMRLPQNRE